MVEALHVSFHIDRLKTDPPAILCGTEPDLYCTVDLISVMITLCSLWAYESPEQSHMYCAWDR